MTSGLVRGRPVKRDGQASDGSETLAFQNNGHVNGDHVTVIKSSVKTTKVVQESATTIIDVIDIDDLPDVDEDMDIDTKRKKTPRRAATIAKKQKTSETVIATPREVKTQRVSAPKSVKKAPVPAKAKADVRETSKAVSEVVSEDSAMQDDVSNAVAVPMKADLDAQKERDEVPCNLVTSSRIPTDIAHMDYPHRYIKVGVGGTVSRRSVFMTWCIECVGLRLCACEIESCFSVVGFSSWDLCRVHCLIQCCLFCCRLTRNRRKTG